MTTNSFIGALQSSGPAPDRADKMELYGWLIGQWTMDAVIHRDDGSHHRGPGEIHFAWVLEGRAIQDVWILPGVFYGTTLRVYDPGIDAWHILWSDPVRQFYSRQIGRARDSDIVQLGKNDAGETVCWSFTEITPDSLDRPTFPRRRQDLATAGRLPRATQVMTLPPHSEEQTR